jgi:hypothetical protein
MAQDEGLTSTIIIAFGASCLMLTGALQYWVF